MGDMADWLTEQNEFEFDEFEDERNIHDDYYNKKLSISAIAAKYNIPIDDVHYVLFEFFK